MPKDASGHMIPGTVTHRRHVPDDIERPEYVGRKREKLSGKGDVYDVDGIERIREAGRIASRALDAVADAVRPGVTTERLDEIGHDYMISSGAYPSSLLYRGFPKSLCTSVNEVICHGIPDDTRLDDGDIVNVDITAYKNGVHGDTNRTFLVGDVSEETRLLVERTKESLRRAIAAVKPGRPISVIGRVIEAYAKRFGYGVIRDFTGHGVGRDFHSGLIVPHYYSDDPRYQTIMTPGMVFTIEPMLTLGGIAWDMWPDGWTITTRDKSLTAQFEHTLVVTDDGAELLTVS